MTRLSYQSTKRSLLTSPAFATALSVVAAAACSGEPPDTDGNTAVVQQQCRAGRRPHRAPPSHSHHPPRENVRICHFPPGERAPQIIMVPKHTVAVHLRHGDTLPAENTESAAECAIARSVGPEGGEIVHPSGLGAVISSGTFTAPTRIELGAIRLDTLDVDELPPDFALVGAVMLEFAEEAAEPIDLFVPPPSDSGSVAFLLARVVASSVGERLAVVDTASIQGGRLTSNSPPFPGARGPGTYAFVQVPAGTAVAVARLLVPGGEPATAAAAEFLGSPSAFRGIAAQDGFVSFPVEANSAASNRTLVAVASKADGGLQRAIAVLPEESVLALPISNPLPPGFPADGIVIDEDIALVKPGSPDPCDLEIKVTPESIPSNGGPFCENASVLLDVECVDPLAAKCSGPRSLHNGDLVFTTYAPESAPVAVGPSGEVTATGVGSGTLLVSATKVCVSDENPWHTERAFDAKEIPVTVSPGGTGDLFLAAVSIPTAPVEPGQFVQFEFPIGNSGPGPVTNLHASVDFTAGLSQPSVRIHPPSGDPVPCGVAALDGGRSHATCRVQRLAVGESAMIEGSAATTVPGQEAAFASVSATEQDPYPRDNSATAHWTVACPQAAPIWDSDAQRCVPAARFLFSGGFRIPCNNPTQIEFAEPNFAAGDSSNGARLSSSVGQDSVLTLLEAAAHGLWICANATVGVYVKGSPGTAYRLEHAWQADATADCTGANQPASAGYNYTFETFGARCSAGQRDFQTRSGTSISNGVTSQRAIQVDGVLYSFARDYVLTGDVRAEVQILLPQNITGAAVTGEALAITLLGE